MAGIWDALNDPVTVFVGRAYLINLMGLVVTGKITKAQALAAMNEQLEYERGPSRQDLIDGGMSEVEADADLASRHLTPAEEADLNAIVDTMASGGAAAKLAQFHSVKAAIEFTERTQDWDPSGNGGNGWGPISPSTFDETKFRNFIGIS